MQVQVKGEWEEIVAARKNLMIRSLLFHVIPRTQVEYDLYVLCDVCLISAAGLAHYHFPSFAALYSCFLFTNRERRYPWIMHLRGGLVLLLAG